MFNRCKHKWTLWGEPQQIENSSDFGTTIIRFQERKCEKCLEIQNKLLRKVDRN